MASAISNHLDFHQSRALISLNSDKILLRCSIKSVPHRFRTKATSLYIRRHGLQAVEDEPRILRRRQGTC